jgi:hypothetical protein
VLVGDSDYQPLAATEQRLRSDINLQHFTSPVPPH